MIEDNESGKDKQTSRIMHISHKARRKKKRFIIITSLILVASGMLIGGGLVLIWGQRNYFGRAIPPGKIGLGLYHRIAKSTSIDDDQKEKIKEIIIRRMETAEQLRSQTRQEIGAEFESMRDEIVQMLPPKEAEEWRQRMNKYAEKFRTHNYRR